MQTIVESAQEILTAEQLAAIQDAVDGKADVTIALTLDQLRAMAAHISNRTLI